jgi:phosphatidylserine/phosphatidylglycerophosphate/cardiolipin synthase-like enzyme
MKPAVLALVLVAACRESGGPVDPPDAAAGAPDARPDARPVVDAPPGADYCNATDPRAMPVVVDATPEAGEAPYVDVLATAEASIDVSIYLMGYGGILDQLEAKARAGVPVRVILDEYKRSTNQQYHDRLVAAGAQVKWSDPVWDYFHAKYFIVDGQVAVMSTGNYSRNYSINLERNFAATDRDPADIADLVALFQADWDGVTPDLSCTRMVVSPINARERILAVIRGAQSTLDIESMQFADSEVRAAVRERVLAGVAVRALLADPDWIDANAGAAVYLQDLGVPVRWMPHNHTKVIVADGTVAYVGSENLSYTSLENNREVGVILVEASSIAPLTSTFEADWAIATDF